MYFLISKMISNLRQDQGSQNGHLMKSMDRAASGPTLNRYSYLDKITILMLEN